MNQKDIEYFAAIAEHRSLTHAAEALDLSTPALSKSLRRLESEVGTKLLERTPKGVHPTAAGHALLARAHLLRLALDDVKREAADIGAGRSGHLRIGVGQAEDELMCAAVARLLEEAPAVSVELTVGNNSELVPLLRSGRLDLVVCGVAGEFLESVQHLPLLFRDTFVVCASKKHPLAARKRLELADLEGQPWAMPTAAVPIRRRLIEKLREANLPDPRIAMESASFRARLHVVAATRLVGLFTKRMLRRVGPPLGIVQLPVRGLDLTRPVGAMVRRGAYLPPAAERLLSLFEIELHT